MSVLSDRLEQIEALRLASGGHSSFEQGACIMEAVSYVAGEPFSDHPECASRLLTSFLIGLNDRFDDEARQLLKPYIVRLVGTNTGPEDEERRKWMLRDWLVHEYAPARFRAAGLTAEAEQFEGLVAITGSAEWEQARDTIYAVRDAAWKRRKEAFQRLNAAAAAAAVADADADADAAAAAAAVADADADAAAAAVAVAVAVAVAAADADADLKVFKEATAAAVAVKKSGGAYWDQRRAAYEVFRPYYVERFRELAPGLRESVLQLVDRLIDVSKREDA